MRNCWILSILTMGIMTCITSCKSNEQNYRAVYDRVIEHQRETDGADEDTYSRIEAERTANTTIIMGDSVRMVTNHVSIVDGTYSDLKPYSVVVGEYKQLFNARSFRDRLKKNGHGSYVVKDSESTYYVIAEGFETSIEAAEYLNDIDNRINIKIPIAKPWILSLPKSQPAS